MTTQWQSATKRGMGSIWQCCKVQWEQITMQHMLVRKPSGSRIKVRHVHTWIWYIMMYFLMIYNPTSCLHGNRFHILPCTPRFPLFGCKYSHYRCHTCFTTSLLPVLSVLLFLCCWEIILFGALRCQQAGYVRDTISVIQHAYSALLYIQETPTCSGCCTVHGGKKMEGCNVHLPLYVL